MTEIETGRRPLLLVLFLGVLLAALDIAMVGPALPALRDYYEVDERAVAWVLNVFVLFNLIGIPLMAKLADSRGRRLVFSLDLVLFVAGALVVASAPPFGVVLVGRALQGIGAAGIFPVSSAVIGDTFPQELQGRALGLLGSVFGIAFIIGPAVSGVLLAHTWRWLFVVTLPLAAVAFVYGRRFVPVVTGERPSARFDLGGLAVLAVALTAGAVAINGIDAVDFAQSLGHPRVWGLGLAALLFGGLFVAISRRVPNPIVPPTIFSSRQSRLAIMLTVAAGFCEAVIIFIPSVAEATFAVSKSTASFMFLPLAIAVAFGSPVFGWLLDRLGPRRIIAICTILLTIGLFAIARFTSTMAFYGGSILVGLALAGLLGSALNYILLRESRLEDRVSAQGIVTLSLNAGLLLGGGAVGALAASGETRRAGYETAFMTIAVLGLIMFLVSLLLSRRHTASQPM